MISSCNVTYWDEPSPIPRAELLKNIAGKNGIYCSLTDKIDKEVLDAAGSSLKVVGTISVGHDHIDVEECRKRGIKIGYTPDVLTDATAELTVSKMKFFLKLRDHFPLLLSQFWNMSCKNLYRNDHTSVLNDDFKYSTNYISNITM